MMWLTLKKPPRKKGMPLDAWTTSYIVWLRQVAAAGGYEQSGHPLARSCEATIQALVPALRPRLEDARFISHGFGDSSKRVCGWWLLADKEDRRGSCQ